MSGSSIARRHTGRDIVVKGLSKDFECEDETIGTLSAVAEAVTGKHWNGYHFFCLNRKHPRSTERPQTWTVCS